MLIAWAIYLLSLYRLYIFNGFRVNHENYFRMEGYNGIAVKALGETVWKEMCSR